MLRQTFAGVKPFPQIGVLLYHGNVLPYPQNNPHLTPPDVESKDVDIVDKWKHMSRKAENMMLRFRIPVERRYAAE